MARSRIILGTQYFPDWRVGRPLALADIYIGDVDLDPEVLANRKTVYLIQEDGTEVSIPPASQPLQTGAGGTVLYLGSPVQLETDDAYSIKILDSVGDQVYYFNSVDDALGTDNPFLQAANFYTNDVSSASNAYVIIPPITPMPDTLLDGQVVMFRPSDNGSGAATINVMGASGPIGPKQWLLPDEANQLPADYVKTTRDYMARYNQSLDSFIDMDMGLFSYNPSIQIWNQYIDYYTVPSYVTGSDDNLYKSTATNGPNLGGDVDPVGDTTGTWVMIINSSDPRIMDFRLTLLSGNAVNNTNITNATTIYITPYIGNRISLYNGGTWVTIESVEKSLALGVMTDEMMYDIFAYLNAGVLTLEKLVWSTANTRATALVYQDGILVKDGDPTRRYIGSFFTNSTTQTGDNALCSLSGSNSGRFVWNYYNRIPRNLYNSFTVGSHTYTTATWRKWNDAAAEVITYCVGVVEDAVEFSMVCASANSNSGVGRAIGIGNNSDTAPEDITCGVGGSGNAANGMFTSVKFLPQLGRNDVYALEYSEASGATTWYASFIAAQSGGINGTVMM